MTGALYTALAILGWLTFCALIAWFVGSVLDYAAQLFDDEAREFAEGTGQRIGAYRASANPSETQVTQLLLPSTPPSCGR
jgi:hypothetical protein